MMEKSAQTEGGKPHNYYLLLGLCAAFFTAYFPVWKNLATAWMGNENYSHGFAIVPLTSFILWRQRGELRQAVGPGQRKGLSILIASLCLYIFSLAGEIQTLSSLSMILFLSGTILYLWGYPLLRLTLYPLALLTLMIPVPEQLLSALTIPLQLLVTDIAGTLARAMGIPILIQGNLIHLPNRIFEVVQACSGLRSIMALVTLGAFIGYFTLNAISLRFFLIASALPIAIVINSARVLAMVVFSYYLNIDLQHGKAHTIFGMGIFIIALCIFFGVQRVLTRWQKRLQN